MEEVPGHIKGLTEGRMVHFVLPNGDHRPAVIVLNWEGKVGGVCPGYINLQVWTDGDNDVSAFPMPRSEELMDSVRHGHFWATSVCMDNEEKKPGIWHWPEPA